MKNYPLTTFWTVTMDIDSACQTKPLLIGSHHVYSKTNFFQVLLPNWNTLLQPSSLFIITPKLIACNTSSKKASQWSKQQTATQKWRHLAIQILLYCKLFFLLKILIPCRVFVFILQSSEEGKIMGYRAIFLLFNDPVTLTVSPWKKLF